MSEAHEWVYGVHPVIEVLRAGRRTVKKLLVATGRRDLSSGPIGGLAEACGLKITRCEREELDAAVGVEKHQGMALQCSPYPYVSPQDVALFAGEGDVRSGVVVLLDGVEDPHNLGSLVRTGHLMGVDGFLVPADRSAQVTPTVVKSSAGAAEHIRIAQVVNLATAMEELKDAGFWIYGAAAGEGQCLYQANFSDGRIAVVLGGEGKGLRRLTRDRCDFLVSIPMRGRIDSYNASVAGALVLGEVMRQRGW